MISVNRAREILSQNASKAKVTTVDLQEGLGCIVAEPIYALTDVPSFDNSAMDGYALAYDGKENEWQLGEVIQAGASGRYSLKQWQAARIFTGAKIPEGADTVIPQELIELNEDKNSICYEGDKIERGANIRLRASQCRKGDLVLEAGTVVSPGIIGLLASVGVAKIAVYANPSVACIITGNELKEVGTKLKEGEIFNSNGPMLQACLRQTGIQSISLLRAPDNKEKLQQVINAALENNDVLLLSGGISVGDYDFVKECLESAAIKELIYKVKQRPGKPFYAGKKQEKWVFALPGNPASVLSCFYQYVNPILKYLKGHEKVWEPGAVLELLEDTHKKPGFTFFLKAKSQAGKVKVLGGQQSFNLVSFREADCFVELKEEEAFVKAGSLVKVYWL